MARLSRIIDLSPSTLLEYIQGPHAGFYNSGMKVETKKTESNKTPNFGILNREIVRIAV